MTNFIKKMLLSLAIGSVMISPALAWDQAKMNKQIDETNVLVNDGCSGTFIEKGKVLTAAHCIIDQYRTVEKEVINEDGTVTKEKFKITMPGVVSVNKYVNSSISLTTAYRYKIERTDRTADLALLKLDIPADVTPAAFSCKDVTRGDTVYAVGNPFGVLYSSLSQGMVGSTSRSYKDLGLTGELGNTTDTGDNGLNQHTALIAGGSSGGALYNDAGQLVGVNVRGGRGFSFSVPLSDILSFIDNKDICSAPLAH